MVSLADGRLSRTLAAAIFLRVLSVLSAFGLSPGVAEGKSQEVKWTHYGIRPLAMGNAFVAVSDDFNALFYNPAGIARLKTWTGELLNPGFEVSKNTMGFIDDISDLQSKGKSSSSDTLDLFANHLGENQHFAVQWVPHLLFPGFGFGIGTEFVANLDFHRQISADVDIGPRVIAPFTYATNFLEDRLSLGASVKFVARGGVNREFDIQTLEAFTKKSDPGAAQTKPQLSDYVEGGTGYGADVGMLFTPIKPMEPTLGVSVTDIGGTPYKQASVGGNAISAPATRLPSVNVGTSFKPISSGAFQLLTAVDMHSVNQPFSFSKKLNLGAELSMGQILKWGVGLHQGYFTTGLQLDVGLLKLRAVTYAEELGPAAGTSMDRRYALQLKLII